MACVVDRCGVEDLDSHTRDEHLQQGKTEFAPDLFNHLVLRTVAKFYVQMS